MKDYSFGFKILMQCLVFFMFLVLIFAIRMEGELINELSDISLEQAKNTSVIVKKLQEVEGNYESLKNFVFENSGIPNEKRKAVFELKIQQDSVLMDLLQGDIRTNKEILKLLDTDWVYNGDTEFKTLKIK